MSDQTLRAMALAACVFAAALLLRALYVMALYKSWTLGELLGLNDDGWETEAMKTKRRDFWR